MQRHYFTESLPNCVPEYYRSKQEDADHEREISFQARERFRANREKLEAARAAGLPVLDFGGYDACQSCPNADHDTMTSEDDDFDHVLCRNPACPRLKRKRGRAR
ncbi:hypothetical protein [uncultured Alistipes sp.]|uniref:hypothetical protein n=1 Tax=uncultured Alistipes sp. TaxID=538949 RepID=UPI00272BD578|nr:hypothetical protein [uncultured Alistipes sp.]